MNSMTHPGIDEPLVRALQRDGRASFSDLARELGMSRGFVAGRVAELTGAGELRIVAAVHPRVLGLNALAHLAIRVTGSAREVASRLTELDGCVFVSLTSGTAGVVAEFRLKDVETLYERLEDIRRIEGVAGIDVLLYKNVARSLFLSSEPPAPEFELDDTDLDILTELQRDGRLPFETLGARVGLSTSATRTRVLRLLGANVMQIGAIRSRSGDAPLLTVGYGMITENGRTDEVVDYFTAVDGVEFIATCFGRFDAVATVAVDTGAGSLAVLEGARTLPSVVSVESWLHLSIVQERYERPLEARVPSSS